MDALGTATIVLGTLLAGGLSKVWWDIRKGDSARNESDSKLREEMYSKMLTKESHEQVCATQQAKVHGELELLRQSTDHLAAKQSENHQAVMAAIGKMNGGAR